MKCIADALGVEDIRSLPVRGAWVEIRREKLQLFHHSSLPLRGAWVEMQHATLKITRKLSRSPCGERGLKFCCLMASCVPALVAPRAGSVG